MSPRNNRPTSLAAGVFAYGVAIDADGIRSIVARRGERVIDVGTQAASADAAPPDALARVLRASSLDPLLAAGPAVWAEADEWVESRFDDESTPGLSASHTMVRPFQVADFVDFYASRSHAENVGRIFRPAAPALPAAWLSLPIGYHGRAGSVVVTETAVRRPAGLVRTGEDIVFGPTAKLDFEAEIGFIVGVPSAQGEPVSIDNFEDHVFGVCVVNDWSARDIQAFEYVPLGPFLGKSFATTVSAWITPLTQLRLARISAPSESDPELAPYLRGAESWGLRLHLEVMINDEVVSRPPYADMYWSPAQMLAHITANGAPLRTGDLFASGTVSGSEQSQFGSMLELTRDGIEPIEMTIGRRGYLEDGDRVSIRATVEMPDGSIADLSAAVGSILPAHAPSMPATDR